jgi:glycosyltransferase involved in cell wall biosynthesis
MKIALCLEYPIDQYGGTEVLISELIRGLATRHQILLVSPDDRAGVVRSRVAGFVSDHFQWLPMQISTRRSRALAERLARAKPDLVHFHFGGNYAWGNRAFRQCPVVHLRRFGVPCLSTNHGAFSIMEGYCWSQRPLPVKLALFLPAWLSKQYVLVHLDVEVAVSQHDYSALRRWYPLARSRFRWIHHSRLQGPPPPPNPNRRRVILCAGTIGARKGQPLLAEAFGRIAAKFPDWQLEFIGRNGDEEQMQRLHEFIARHKLERQIQLLGPRSDEELRTRFQQAAIFAMPSRYEGLGLSLQEAQFCGCACVATRCGGVVDLIQDGDNGLLVPVGQPAPLAAALARLMADAALRERFAARGPQSVLEKDMTAEKMVQAYERLYAEILNQSRRGL